jgi:hypothetical protein
MTDHDLSPLGFPPPPSDREPQSLDPQYQVTSGYAIAALCCGIGSLLCGLSAILAIILGFVARRNIRGSGGYEKGNGLALAGIILGTVYLVVVVAAVVIISITAKSNPNSLGVQLAH